MAATKQLHPTPPAAAQAINPKFEWAEKVGNYELCLALPGFKKDDFKVQVDGAGKLTIRGTRPGTVAATLHKVFQLPTSASLDDIAGRFQAGVLTLTVPKRVSASAGGAGAGAAPTSIEEIKRKQPGVAKESKPKEEEIAKEDALKKSMDEAANKAEKQKLEEEKGKSRKQEQQKKEEDVKPRTPRSAAASPPQKTDVAATTAEKAKQQKQQEEEASRRKQEQQKPASVAAAAGKEEDVKPKAPQAAAAAPPKKPDVDSAGADKAKTAIAPESPAERVRRRGVEEEHENAAPMAAAKRAKTDGEKKALAACGGWKERVKGELKVLTDLKWADGLVEAARNNKEVVAVGIAAFSLGFLVSHKLFRK